MRLMVRVRSEEVRLVNEGVVDLDDEKAVLLRLLGGVQGSSVVVQRCW